jgi:CubicO group peptidase (beta-lactamase class C family)
MPVFSIVNHFRSIVLSLVKNILMTPLSRLLFRRPRCGWGLLLLVPSLVFAQRRNTAADSLENVVVRLFNQEKAGAIYQMLDRSFQSHYPREGFVNWLNREKQSRGKIAGTKWSGQLDGWSVYQLYFQKDPTHTMSLLLAVQGNKISGLAIRPLISFGPRDQPVRDNNPLKNSIDSLVEKNIRPYIQQAGTVGISIGIICGGKTYTYGYGETKKGNGQLPDDRTIFEIGSITKTFTASLLAALVLEKRCRLNDPVSKYLPDSLPLLQTGSIPVTLKMLANHTSGLPRVPSDLEAVTGASPSDPYARYDDNDLFSYLDTVRLRSVPGLRMQYSNLGFGLLGTVLEKISGLPYQKLLQEQICDQLKMGDTRTVLNSEQQKRFAQGNNGLGETGHWHFESLAGCGAIRSTVHDLLLYLQAHFKPGDATLLTGAFRLCERPTFNLPGRKTGLAWMNPDGLPHTYWHNGGTGGFRTFCAYNPDQRVAVVVLANSTVSTDKAGFALIRAFTRDRLVVNK